MYGLQKLHIEDSEIDLTSVKMHPSSFAKLKTLSLRTTDLMLPSDIKLENVLHLDLYGNDCIIKSLRRFGQGLISLRTFTVEFDGPFFLITNYLPDSNVLDLVHINHIRAKRMFHLSKFFKENWTCKSKETIITVYGLNFDTFVEGLENFPRDYLQNLVPNDREFKNINLNFKVTDQSIPRLETLSFGKDDIKYSKH